ncbi:MAG: hypothetical protein V7K21_06490, partial [Nostoc sp.]|uniref:hypothetical protein n=1 Tax=Nostoc sp. TaxID=1180 RepID=UPI002FF896D4
IESSFNLLQLGVGEAANGSFSHPLTMIIIFVICIFYFLEVPYPKSNIGTVKGQKSWTFD